MAVPYMDIEVQGMKQLEKELSGLRTGLRKKALARGCSRAGALMRKMARKRAKSLGLKASGDMIKAIRVKRKKTKDRDTVIYGVGYSGSGWYGRLYEYGFRNPTGRRTQRPLLRSILDESKDEIIKELVDNISSEIKKIAAAGVTRGIVKPVREFGAIKSH